MASNGHADKDLERGYDDVSHEEKARNALTNTLTLSPQRFEQLYLAPKRQVTGGFFALANGHDALASKLTIGLGACFFGADMCGWYLLLANMITTMELLIPDLPVFDLSTVIRARPHGVAKVD